MYILQGADERYRAIMAFLFKVLQKVIIEVLLMLEHSVKFVVCCINKNLCNENKGMSKQFLYLFSVLLRTFQTSRSGLLPVFGIP